MGEVDAIEPQLAGRLATDPQALDCFYRRYVDEMIRFFTRRVTTPAEVADLVADTFVAAVEASSRFDPRRGQDRPWLYGIATRVLASSRRRSIREAHAVARLSGRRLLEYDDIVRLEERLAAEAQFRAVHDALAALSGADRALLELIALDGLSPRDAAAALCISAPAARMRLSRVRSRARKLLDIDVRVPTTARTQLLLPPEA